MAANLWDIFSNGNTGQPGATTRGSMFDAFAGGAQSVPSEASGRPSPSQQPGGMLSFMGDGLQMAQRLAQSPTPQTARAIIQQLHQMQNPEAAQFEKMITQVMDNPQALQQLAGAVVQKLGGGNA